MSRHLGDLDDAEFGTLEDRIVDWLEAHNVAGSILGAYSIYTAVEEEQEKARLAREAQRESEKEESQLSTFTLDALARLAVTECMTLVPLLTGTKEGTKLKQYTGQIDKIISNDLPSSRRLQPLLFELGGYLNALSKRLQSPYREGAEQASTEITLIRASEITPKSGGPDDLHGL